jgi:hypothetical protein
MADTVLYSFSIGTEWLAFNSIVGASCTAGKDGDDVCQALLSTPSGNSLASGDDFDTVTAVAYWADSCCYMTETDDTAIAYPLATATYDFDYDD